MGGVYFSIPLIIGYFTMTWAIDKSNEKWGIDAQTGEYKPETLPMGVRTRNEQVLEHYKEAGREQMEAVKTQPMDPLVYGKEVTASR